MLKRVMRSISRSNREEIARNSEKLARDAAAETIRASHLFDEAWYLERNRDVAAAGLDPIAHYVESGAAEGRDPSPSFDTVWYLSENYHVASAGLNPLLHYIEDGRAAGLAPAPLNGPQKFEAFDKAIKNGLLDGTQIYPRIDRIDVALDPQRREASAGRLPLPPIELSLRIGSPTLEGFTDIGQETKRTIVRCLPGDFSFEGARCLDFGCGVGRVIRHFEDEARTGEFWGCDIDGTSIHWCMTNLVPPFRFFQLSDSPVLPFESCSFDLVYAVAVFSQVFDNWSMWAMEIRRILKPGGSLFLSYNGQTPYEEQFMLSYEELIKTHGMLVANPYQPWNKGGPTVILSPEWMKRLWGSMFDIDFIALEGLMDYQSICMMRKPAAGRPRPTEPPVVALSTIQAFHPDATGKLAHWHDPAKPFLDSFGIQRGNEFDVAGWIVFRQDRPVSIETFVDDRPITSTTAFTRVGPYRDWNSEQFDFVVNCRATDIGRGNHMLKLLLRSEKGLTHALSIPLEIQ